MDNDINLDDINLDDLNDYVDSSAVLVPMVTVPMPMVTVPMPMVTVPMPMVACADTYLKELDDYLDGPDAYGGSSANVVDMDTLDAFLQTNNLSADGLCPHNGGICDESYERRGNVVYENRFSAAREYIKSIDASQLIPNDKASEESHISHTQQIGNRLRLRVPFHKLPAEVQDLIRVHSMEQEVLWNRILTEKPVSISMEGPFLKQFLYKIVQILEENKHLIWITDGSPESKRPSKRQRTDA